MGGAVAAFLLAFPALFSIVNPAGGAFIFNEVTAEFSHAERRLLAGKVGFYSFMVMLGALWGGAYLLSFFGISLGALRIAGGAVVALRAYDLLNAPERQEARKQEQAEPGDRAVDEIAFFPLTMPFTTGPGTIAVAIARSAGRPAQGVAGFFLGVTLAAVAIALCVWVAYGFADRVAGLVGATARRTIARLTAFLLLCIGTQIVVSGISDIVAGLARGL
jgi:multiple antibiotic resistance protein